MVRADVVDRITLCEPGVRAEGTRNVSDTESVFSTHFPHRPVLPGVLLTASAVRLACWAAAAEVDFTRAATLVGLAGAKYRRFVEPGDQVVLSARRRPGAQSTWRVVASVGGVRAAVIEAVTLELVEQSLDAAERDREEFQLISGGHMQSLAVGRT